MKKRHLLGLALLCNAAVFLAPIQVWAQDPISSGVAVDIAVEGDNVTDGTIVCQDPQGNVLCSREYDPQIYGVVTLTPAVSFDSTTSANLRPVITSGKAYVYVTSINGPIHKGDFVTSSTVAGVGQKASRSGFVLGSAMQDYVVTDVNTRGKILISIQPRPAILTQRASANLIELIKQGIDASYLSPLMALRYLLAAALTVGSVVIGFLFFGRVAGNGVVAIGRNPLAQNAIQLGILINVILTVGIMAAGVGLSYLLLTL